jgi:acetyl-CoA/propionyl-CoA carboxylase biotin carboxyl carrier protein
VIEEAPSVLLSAAQRERIGAAAVEVARAADYTGVGTVEFLVPAARPEEFFFLEMNTRLQVEHPVTEQVVRVATARLDLVEQQLRVAAGERLAFGQADIWLSGHAVEARVYAEDPARGFLPTGGPALLVREPVGPGVRIDSSLVEGARVGTTYDPLLSKVIAWGSDRATALARLDRALAAQVLLGVGTNTAFLRTLLAHPDVRAGRLDTGLIERELEHLVEPEPPERAYQAYALLRLLAVSPQTDDPWAVLGGWRLSGSAEMSLQVAGPDGSPVHLAVSGQPAAAHVRIGAGEPVAASAVRLDDGLLLTVADRSFRVLSAVDDDTTWLWLDGATYAIAALAPRLRGTDAGASGGEVRSPMPGAVIAVHAKPGDVVRKGDVLVVVEAMKMEHGLPAPSDGTVGPLAVRLGDQVALGQLVTTVTAAP